MTSRFPSSVTCCLTRRVSVTHPKHVVTVRRRLSSLALVLALVAGNVALCAGWTASPEARMACCAEGSQCPMHQSDASESQDAHAVTQARADACCAASERHGADPNTPTLTLTPWAVPPGAPIVLPAYVPPPVLADGWHVVARVSTTLIPRHLLLSVFLV